MKFPIKHCVPTSLLTQEIYSELICKMVTDGYTNNISNIQIVSLAKMWDYVGVDNNSNICLYDKPLSFLEINEWMNYLQVKDDMYYNVLTEEQLGEYLK